VISLIEIFENNKEWILILFLFFLTGLTGFSGSIFRRSRIFYPVKCLPNEMRSLFHRGEAYLTGEFPHFLLENEEQKNPVNPVNPV